MGRICIVRGMSKQHAIVMWVIWFAFLQSAFVYHFFLGDGFPSGENAVEPMAAWIWVVCFVPLVLATIIRWLVLPELTLAVQQFVAMVVGLCLTEVAILFELFLVGADYPQYQIVVLMVAVLSLIQFAPSYATPGMDAGAGGA